MSLGGRRILIIRLSSLGDVILATSVLERLSPEDSVDWVVSRAFASVLEGHPRIRRLWIYDPSTGLAGWRHMAQSLFFQGYTDVWDLHASLRSGFFRFWFQFWGLSSVGPPPAWARVRKSRWKWRGYALFKKLWPKALRPRPWREVFCETVGQNPAPGSPPPSGGPRPSLPPFEKAAWPVAGPSEPQSYFCVMPSSRWPGKQWPAESFATLMESMTSRYGVPVILGTANDTNSLECARLLQERGVSFLNGVGAWTLPETGRVLSGATCYLGCDTGLAHLAEAMGIPAFVIFGPNRPDMGFGPWRAESRALERSLWCRPCGKDGRSCHRIFQRYACLKGFSPQEARQRLP